MASGSGPVDFFRYRWRALLGGAAGIVAALAARAAGLMPGAVMLVAWNAAAAVFLVPTVWAILTDDEDCVRRRAAHEDENKAVLMTVILSAVAASLVAIVVALKESKGGHHGASAWIVGLSISTLVLSWSVVQSLFTLHYAHRYFGDFDDDGHIDGGIKFPGADPTTYKDFVYVAICIGATCQVSDFNITSASIRNLVTVHALVAFVFNTMVLALGINIIASLLGQ